jgi:hypothetical protein
MRSERMPTCADSAFFSQLSCFERPAAFQTTCFVTRCNESAKRADPLGREVANMAFDLEELPQGCGQQSNQTTNTGTKRMRREGHGCNSSVLTLHDQRWHITPQPFCARLLALKENLRFLDRIEIEGLCNSK